MTKRTELSQAILSLLNQSSDKQALATSIAAYLVEQRQTKELNSLLRDLDEMRFKTTGTLEATATTARPLSDEAKQKIRAIFDAEKVNINEQIDPQILGGVRVRALDKVADFSVQARLRRLRRGV